jgi:hypothetical protein
LSNYGGLRARRPTAGHRRVWVAAEGGSLIVRVRVWGFGVGGSSMATEPRGRSRGGCRTDGGGGVWAEWWAAAAPPAGVVEAGWARVGSGGGLVSNRRRGARWRRIRRRRAHRRRTRCRSRGGWVSGGGKQSELLGRAGLRGEGRLVGDGR